MLLVISWWLLLLPVHLRNLLLLPVIVARANWQTWHARPPNAWHAWTLAVVWSCNWGSNSCSAGCSARCSGCICRQSFRCADWWTHTIFTNAIITSFAIRSALFFTQNNILPCWRVFGAVGLPFPRMNAASFINTSREDSSTGCEISYYLFIHRIFRVNFQLKLTTWTNDSLSTTKVIGSAALEEVIGIWMWMQSQYISGQWTIWLLTPITNGWWAVDNITIIERILHSTAVLSALEATLFQILHVDTTGWWWASCRCVCSQTQCDE